MGISANFTATVLCAASASFSISIPSVRADPPRIVGISVPDWATASDAGAVSTDGRTVLAHATWRSPTGFEKSHAYLWTEETGLRELPSLFGAQRVYATGMTADASDVIGYYSGGWLVTTESVYSKSGSLRWHNGVVEPLDTVMNAPYSTPRAISPSGDRIIGYGTGSPIGLGALRWNTIGNQPVEFLPVLSGMQRSFAEAMTPDAAIVVGSAYIGESGSSSHRRAIRWDASGASDLGTLPGYTDARATGVSQNGGVVTGYSFVALGAPQRACMWTSSGIRDLGTLPGFSLTLPTFVSLDGSVVGGFATDPSSPFSRAFIWTDANGMHELNPFLSARGVDLSRWTLTAFAAIGVRNTVLTGSGIHQYQPGRFRTEGWVITLPVDPTCAADFNHLDGLTVQDVLDFLGAWFAGDPRADFNGAGLSAQDIFDFLNAWFSGC